MKKQTNTHAAIARVVPVPPPKRDGYEGMMGELMKNDASAFSIIVDAYKRGLILFKAFRRDLYARTDMLIGNLADAQKRHAELSGMLEVSALLSNHELDGINGHAMEIIEHDRQYVAQVIKSLSGGSSHG